MATIIPLTVIIIVGIIKEAVVELKKAFDDKHINESLYKKYVNHKGLAVSTGGESDRDGRKGLLRLQSVLPDASEYYSMFEDV